MKDGAVDFLVKPVATTQFLHALAAAMDAHRAAAQQSARIANLRLRFQSLSMRQREVAALVGEGLLNKQIAADLGISEKTVKVHRALVMAKLEVECVPDLVRFLKAIRGAGVPSRQ